MNNNNTGGGFSPKDLEAELRAKKNTEAFLNMAEELSDESQFEQDEVKTIDMSKTQDRLDTLKMKSSVPSIGPKYLEALDTVLELADIRSIETQLPIMKVKVEVSPLTGQEEQVLRSASISPASFLKKVDELLFTHSKFEDRQYTSYHDFLAELYPPDKSMLIWALLSASYLVLPTLEKTCQSCEKNYIVDSSPEEMIHDDTIKAIWDKEISPSQYTESQCALGDKITFEVGMPSERDRLIITEMIHPETAKDNVEKGGNLMSYTDNLVFFSKAVIVGSEEDNDRIVLTNPEQDIYPFLKNVPPKILDAIKDGIDLSVFDNYMPKFYIKGKCSHCGAVEDITLDPEIAFFRKTISL